MAASKPRPEVAPVRTTVLPANETAGSVGGVYCIRRRRSRAAMLVIWGEIRMSLIVSFSVD